MPEKLFATLFKRRKNPHRRDTAAQSATADQGYLRRVSTD